MSNAKLYVGNLNYKTTADEIREMFSQHGSVTDVIVMEGKGFGFVTMDTQEAADRAKEALNGTEVGGRTLRVNDARPAQPKGNRPFNSSSSSRPRSNFRSNSY